MASFRKEILGQIERIDTGRIFTFRDLSFETEKTANVAVLLSEQSRKGVLVRVEKGAYYRPKKSVLGLGKLPVYQDEQFRYLTEKLNGYITGAYIYNKMGLTEQVATTITIATPNPVRRFRFKNLDIECVKAYCMVYPDESLVPYLRLLDAIKDMKRIPGTTGQDIYNRVKSQYFNGYRTGKTRIFGEKLPATCQKGGGGHTGRHQTNRIANGNGKDHSSHDTVQLGL